jgi:hypothetical protein
MNVFSEELVWRGVGLQSELIGVNGDTSAAEELFPDDIGILERFNRGPETEELCRELMHALHEVGRFLSILMVVPATPKPKAILE